LLWPRFSFITVECPGFSWHLLCRHLGRVGIDLIELCWSSLSSEVGGPWIMWGWTRSKETECRMVWCRYCWLRMTSITDHLQMQCLHAFLHCHGQSQIRTFSTSSGRIYETYVSSVLTQLVSAHPVCFHFVCQWDLKGIHLELTWDWLDLYDRLQGHWWCSTL
jgi:hypothetical protein